MPERELIRYLPVVVGGIQEYQKITAAQQMEINTLWTNARAVRDDQFIHDATVNGISRWESILNIIPKATETLDDRKFTILTKINSQLPYTMTTLKNHLENLCGKGNYALRLEHRAYALYVQVGLAAKSNYDDVMEMLKEILPANLVINLSLKYNQHSLLRQFNHVQLAAWTHYHIRNEVL